MNRASKPILLLTAAAFALSACTTSSTGSKTQDAAIVGAVFGAIVGSNKKGGKSGLGNVLLGAAIGGAIGGALGSMLDAQEKSLNESLGDDRIQVVNTGDRLIVTMPEAITFNSGSTAVRSFLQSDLRVLASSLNEFPDSTVDVFGHTDNVGTASFNQQLSAERASAVASILLSNGVASNRVRAIGRGEDEPVASNLSTSGRAANRRVEIVIRPIQ